MLGATWAGQPRTSAAGGSRRTAPMPAAIASSVTDLIHATGAPWFTRRWGRLRVACGRAVDEMAHDHPHRHSEAPSRNPPGCANAGGNLRRVVPAYLCADCSGDLSAKAQELHVQPELVLYIAVSPPPRSITTYPKV